MRLAARVGDYRPTGLWNDSSGATALMAGLSFTVLLGFAGLATDVASWQVAKSAMHGAADRAAYSAAVALSAGTDATTEGKAIAAQLGFVDGQSSTSVTINNPPLSGDYSGDATAVEVIISQPAKQFFSQIWMGSQPTISSRAVAAAATGDVCMLALDNTTGDNHSFFVKGTGNTVNIRNCTLADNGQKSTDTIDVKGTATLIADNVYLVSGSQCDSLSCQGTYTVGTTKTSQKAVADPYADRTIPSANACDHTNFSVTTSQSIDPGSYCSNNSNAAISIANPTTTLKTSAATASGGKVLTFSSTTGVTVGLQPTDNNHTTYIPSGTTVTAVTSTTVTLSNAVIGNIGKGDQISFPGNLAVTMNPGVYILQGQGGTGCSLGNKPKTCSDGDFQVTGGATVTGTGVTIVLTTKDNGSSAPYKIGNLNIDDDSVVNLTAPTSGTTAGMVVWQDARAFTPSSPGSLNPGDAGVNSINSGATANLTGVVYLPSQALVFGGGSGGTACTQVIAWSIAFIQDASFSYGNCTGTGTVPIGGTPGLVE